MPYVVPIDEARRLYPEYTFIAPLTPSEQKAAFHVQDEEGSDLCLKIIAPDYDIERLNREVYAMQRIAHPNVARLKEYEFSTRNGVQRHYFVEEFIKGSDLSDFLVDNNPMDRSVAAILFAFISDGLAELNAKGIVHRDLKPSNIRVKPDGEPVIIDFGVARHLALPDLTLTRQGAAIGTPLYFAPEQVSGTKRDIEHRTDLFALGILLYQAAVGVHPFYKNGMLRGQLDDAITGSTEYMNHPVFVSLPSEWKVLLGRLLEKDRGKRPQSAGQVATILRKIGGK